MPSPQASRPPSFLAHVFSGGFRPFFLFGAVHAALMIALWVPWFLGAITVPSAFAPVVWHQHELLFGFVPAVIAGFLLTAVPNWTGRRAFAGWPLALLFGLWFAGRLAVACSDTIGLFAAMAVAGAFLPVLAGLVFRELAAAGNRRNYKVVAILALLFSAQLLFFCEVRDLGHVVLADRLAIATIIFLIALIGGRIIPNFTANWLRQKNPGPLSAAFGRFDLVVMGASGVALVAWPLSAALPALAPIAGLLLIGGGIAQFARQLRWRPERTFAEPLVTILHVAFFFIPLGFMLTGAALLLDDVGLRTAGVHAWTSGAIGCMTLAVMTRATRGHTGQPLHAPASTTYGIYVPAVMAAVLRIVAALSPQWTESLLPCAAVFWVLAFLGYAVFYGPLILRRRLF